MFTLTIKTENAAFKDSGDNGEIETARLLVDASKKILNGKRDGLLIDYNGNRVGSWEFTE